MPVKSEGRQQAEKNLAELVCCIVNLDGMQCGKRVEISNEELMNYWSDSDAKKNLEHLKRNWAVRYSVSLY